MLQRIQPGEFLRSYVSRNRFTNFCNSSIDRICNGLMKPEAWSIILCAWRAVLSEPHVPSVLPPGG